MITREKIIEILKESGALLSGHFEFSSGLHGQYYIQCALVLQNPELAEVLCGELAKKVKKYEPEIVIGPALGGVIVAYEVARALGTKGIFSERKNGKMQLRRGFSIKPGQRVLVVEDVVTTGGSVKEVIETVKSWGGNIAAVATLIDRSDGRAEFDVPFHSLLKMENLPAYSPEECPYCKQGIPLEKPGSRA